MTGKNSCIVLSSIHAKKVKKVLAFPCFFIYNQIVVTLIALKREVAVSVKAGTGFPWSECQVVKTGDKSLYELQSIYFCMYSKRILQIETQCVDFTIHTEECTVTTCRATSKL